MINFSKQTRFLWKKIIPNNAWPERSFTELNRSTRRWKQEKTWESVANKGPMVGLKDWSLSKPALSSRNYSSDPLTSQICFSAGLVFCQCGSWSLFTRCGASAGAKGGQEGATAERRPRDTKTAADPSPQQKGRRVNRCHCQWRKALLCQKA